ncbi:MAG: hypothetical protein M0Q42_09405 [Xanthomonadales bacterium]|nr:hypothetical protein [Xanthomonadales bacterium]
MTSAHVDDLYQHQTLARPVAGGAAFAFICTQANRQADRHQSAVWCCHGIEPPRRLTSPQEGAAGVYLHPEAARLAFLRAVDGVPGVHLIELQGGEARLLAVPGDGAIAI